jgi:Rps23 Pro-64 3,4-dihydroxylase Tpa1-like proline 4-hydroxylase
MASDPTVRFALRDDIDVAASAAEYAREGRVHLPALLAGDGAGRLHHHLASELSWTLVFNHGDKLYELDAAQRAQLDARQLSDLVRAAQNTGRDRFQYLYENVRVADAAAARAADPALLARFADFLNAPPFLDFARRLTGRPDITFADAQATCYREGHFLTTHDDAVDGKNRVAAYVVGLTPAWRAEWGGLLQFEEGSGRVFEGWLPRFNTLNLLRVPQRHFVSCVTPLAGSGAARYSITGWLRTGTPP